MSGHYDASFKALDLSGFLKSITDTFVELKDAIGQENERQAKQAMAIAEALEKLDNAENTNG